jgi:hypothetical protein
MAVIDIMPYSEDVSDIILPDRVRYRDASEVGWGSKMSGYVALRLGLAGDEVSST